MTWVKNFKDIQNWRIFLLREHFLADKLANEQMKYAEQCSWRSPPQIPHSVQRRVAKLRPIAGIKRDERRRGGGVGGGREMQREKIESERKVKLCAFWHLRYPKVVPLAVTWRSVRALCTYPGPLSLSRSSPGRLIVMRIATIQRARTRVQNRLGGLKPVCVGDGPPTLRWFANAVICEEFLRTDLLPSW